MSCDATGTENAVTVSVATAAFGGVLAGIPLVQDGSPRIGDLVRLRQCSRWQATRSQQVSVIDGPSGCSHPKSPSLLLD
jgi:hypothetical protein